MRAPQAPRCPGFRGRRPGARAGSRALWGQRPGWTWAWPFSLCDFEKIA